MLQIYEQAEAGDAPESEVYEQANADYPEENVYEEGADDTPAYGEDPYSGKFDSLQFVIEL